MPTASVTPNRQIVPALADVAPAALLAGSMTVALAVAQLFPPGEHLLLVRLPTATREAALAAANAAGATLAGTPAPGYAIVRGSGSRVRAALGWAALWRGRAPCSTPR